MEKKLTIVIPAFNEEKSLITFLPEVLSFCEKNNFSIIVTNDGSKDNTLNVLKKYDNSCLKIINHKVNKGYGGAIKSAIEEAASDYVITIDADGQHDLNDVIKLYNHLRENDADMVVGSRLASRSSSVYRGVGKWLIRRIAKFLLPLNIQDINSGIKIYKTQLAKKYLPLCPDSMAYSDIIALVFISQHHLVKEIPVNILQRKEGKSTISTRTAFQTVLEIINIVMLFNPMKIFLPMALLFFVSGVAWGLPIVLAGKGISVGAMLSITTAIIFFVLGLLAEQLSNIRKNQIK